MSEIVGIRFKLGGRVYYFDPAGIELDVNDQVVVETSRGLELGRVVISPKQVVASETTEPLKPVLRKAEPEDLERQEELKGKEKEAFVKCRELISRYHLPMKLLAAEYNLDGSRLSFSFCAEGRVDFRDLIRELAATFKTRVEMRQVGPRDEAKLRGGYGRCGRPLCCASFLSDFAPVSMKMAKEQELPLNPMKISGVCGRLLCCLGYEYESYRLMKQKLPKIGQRVSTSFGPASVVGGNPLKETVTVQLESQATVELPLSQVTVETGPQGKPGGRGKRTSIPEKPA